MNTSAVQFGRQNGEQNLQAQVRSYSNRSIYRVLYVKESLWALLRHLFIYKCASIILLSLFVLYYLCMDFVGSKLYPLPTFPIRVALMEKDVLGPQTYLKLSTAALWFPFRKLRIFMHYSNIYEALDNIILAVLSL